MAETLPSKPRAIIVISGHWEEPEFTVYKHANPPLFYDYYGFPEHTYKLVIMEQISTSMSKFVFDKTNIYAT